MRKGLVVCCLLAFVISCGDKDKLPKDVLPEEKMRDVLWDMMNAGQYVSMYVLTKDSTDKIAGSAKVYGQVFQLHKINRDQFEKSYTYYREHPELLRVILDSLSKKQAYTVEKFQLDTPVRKKIMMEK